MRRIVTFATMVAMVLVVTGSAMAADQVRKSFNLPADYTAVISATGCTGSPGPQITFQQGSLTLAGVTAEVIFSNLQGEPGQQDIVVAQSVVPNNQQVAIPGQSVVGGIGDNPFIWLQITDQNDKPLTSELFLGRCDQAQFNVAAAVEVPMTSFADITTAECESPSGPAVSLDGQTELMPIHGKLIFRSSDDTTPRGRNDEVAVDLVLLPTGQTYPFPQQAAVAGTGGNPLISIQLREEGGDAIGSRSRLGRCVALAN
ncbi:MAG: hypothetical protein ACREAA_19995 [Candidatus Polarisedimenticolia bacterium]